MNWQSLFYHGEISITQPNKFQAAARDEIETYLYYILKLGNQSEIKRLGKLSHINIKFSQ